MGRIATGFIDIMKRAAIEANEAAKYADLRVGKVASINPLQIRISNDFVLPESVLIVPQHLSEYEVEMTIDEVDKTVTIKNSLNVGDIVALIRKHGGQSYYILDRI